MPAPDAELECSLCPGMVYRRGLCFSHYREAGRAGLTRRQRRAGDVIEDVTFLLESGETHPETITRRAGYTDRRSLLRALRRAGRDDLADRIVSAARALADAS